MKQLLIIHTHQKYEGISEGKLNETLAGITKQFFDNIDWKYEETFISKGYNSREEVEKHLMADLVIIHTPIFWFNTSCRGTFERRVIGSRDNPKGDESTLKTHYNP